MARELLVPAFGVVCLLASRSAQACGASAEETYFSFGAPTPSDGSTDVPLDAPIVLGVNAYSIDGSASSPQLLLVEDAALTDPDGHVVPLRSPLGEVWGSEQLSQVFMPRAPLLANTLYHFSARLAEQSVPRPADAIGSGSVELEVTTGGALTSELSLTGELEVSVTSEQVPVLVCAIACGSSCTESGTRSARIAHVLLPAANGGSGLLGYQSVLHLSDDRAIDVGTDRPFTGTVLGHELHLQTWQQLQPDMRQLVDIELPLEPFAYRPCFTLQVWDPGERHVAALAKCLDSKVSVQSDPPAVSNEQPGASPSPSSSASSEACGVASGVGQRGRRGWPGFALAALLGLVANARRARRRVVTAPL